MPAGIILASSSQGATKEAVEKVMSNNGYEPEQVEAAVEEAVEPKRDDFKSDEEFEQAQDEFATKQEEAAEKLQAEEDEKLEEEERKRAAAQPGRSRRQKAVDKATRELRAENRKLAERLTAIEGGKKPAAEAAPKIVAPKREDFKTDEEFEEAKFDYRYKMRRMREETDNAQRTQHERLRETLTTYETSVAEFKETHDDWDDVISSNKSPIHESVYLAILELPNGPQVTYYLGKHPDVAKHLAEISPLTAAMEVGRLSDKLKGGSKTQKPDGERTHKPRPRLPEPVKPVSTAATASTLTSSEAAKRRDYRAFRAAQRAGR